MAKKDQSKEELAVTLSPKKAPRGEMQDAKREVTRSPGFVSIYANDIQVQTSPWDLRLTFAELGDLLANADGNVIGINQLADIRISPQIAKQLVSLIHSQLQAYELQFGEIPQPPMNPE